MRRLLPLLCLVTALGAGLFLVACGDDTPTTAEVARAVAAGFPNPNASIMPVDVIENRGEPWGPYAGSEACKRCHEEEYGKWRKSFHSRTLYVARQGAIMGDFSGDAIFSDPEYPTIVEPFSYEDPNSGKLRYFMKVRWRRPDEGGPPPEERDTYGTGLLPELGEGHTFEIDFAFGNRKHQPYVGRTPDGQSWVMPVAWDENKTAWMYDGFRPYVHACAHCHVTGVKSSARPWHARQPSLPLTGGSFTRYNLPPSQEGWADGAVGCENCHGPGRAHIRSVEVMGEEAYRLARASGELDSTIWNARDATSDNLVEDNCGRCHNFFTESSHSWRPGPQGYETQPHTWPLEQTERNTGSQFYEDGSYMTPCKVIEMYRTSKMHASGVTCFDCHDPHGTDDWADLLLPVHNNELCLKCHGDEFPTPEAQSAHSKHPIGGAGNRCVECHMPRHLRFSNGVHTMSKQVYSHVFTIPTGEVNEGGPPASCNICHTDKDAAWTRREIKRLWGKKDD